MEDIAHHLRLHMLVNQPSLKIMEIKCEMVRIPDPICQEADRSLDLLIGERIVPGLMRRLDKEWAANGCTHLRDLFHDACYDLTQAQSVIGKEDLTKMFPGLTEAQMFHIFFWFRPDIKDSCIRYSENAPFMKEINNTDLPPGAEKLKAVAAGR